MLAARCCIAENTVLDRTIIRADKIRSILYCGLDAVKPYYEVLSASLTPSSGSAALIEGYASLGIEYIGLFCLEWVPNGD